MAYKVVITQLAEEDTEEAYKFIEADCPTAAQSWIAGIQKVMESLNELPHRGAPLLVSTGLPLNHRNLIFGKHRIVYRVEEPSQTVFIVRVYHVARTPLGPEHLR